MKSDLINFIVGLFAFMWGLFCGLMMLFYSQEKYLGIIVIMISFVVLYQSILYLKDYQKSK